MFLCTCVWSLVYSLGLQFSRSSLRPPWIAARQASLSITNSWSLRPLQAGGRWSPPPL